MKRTIVIAAAGAGTRLSEWKSSPKPLVKLCGIPLIERNIRLGTRAGFSDFVIVIGYRGNEIQQALGDGSKFGANIRYVQNGKWELSNGVSVLKAGEAVSGEFVLLMSDHLYDPQFFEKLHLTQIGTDDLVLFTDSRIDTIYDLDDATKVETHGDRIAQIGKHLNQYDTIDTGAFICSPRFIQILNDLYQRLGNVSISEGVKLLAKEGKARCEDVGDAYWQDVDSKGSYKHAEEMLLQYQKKPTDVWVSRNLNRPISLFLSKYLCRLSIGPNVISFFSMAIGFLSPLFLIQGDYLDFVFGAFLYHFSSVVDGCDGEVARLKFMESKRGEWVDTIADNISHVLFTIGLALGLYQKTENPVFYILGALALFGMGTLLWVMTNYLVKVAKSGSLVAFDRDYAKSVEKNFDLSTRIAKALKPLLRRATFAFLFFVLAVMGRLDLVLFLIAFGTNLATVMVYLTSVPKVQLEPKPEGY